MAGNIVELMLYAVVMTCRSGTVRLTGYTPYQTWEDEYHNVTYSVENTPEEAERVAANLRSANSKEVREVRVEPRSMLVLQVPTPEQCSHERLNEDGICRACGADKRGMG